MMPLMNLFSEEIKLSQKGENYERAQVFSTAEDLTDGMGKGIASAVALPRIIAAFTRNQNEGNPEEACYWGEAIALATAYGEEKAYL